MSAVSVIVPIFQSEITLRRCLDSILSQTLREIEVLLVNDGSTDNSAEICDEYAQNDSRIRLFYKTHSGVSDARQLGLENAVGEYVIHCDSDDWMEASMLAELFSKAKETDADMVVCDYFREKESGKTVHREFHNGLDSNKPIAKQVKYLSYCMWNKLVKRSLFEKFNLTFPQGILMAEDVYVTMILLNHNIHVEYVPLTLYHYDHTYNHHNVTSNMTKDVILSNMKVIEMLDGVISNNLKKKLYSNKKKVFLDCCHLKEFSRKDLRNIFVKYRLFMPGNW